jgi:hypothetical protein
MQTAHAATEARLTAEADQLRKQLAEAEASRAEVEAKLQNALNEAGTAKASAITAASHLAAREAEAATSARVIKELSAQLSTRPTGSLSRLLSAGKMSHASQASQDTAATGIENERPDAQGHLAAVQESDQDQDQEESETEADAEADRVAVQFTVDPQTLQFTARPAEFDASDPLAAAAELADLRHRHKAAVLERDTERARVSALLRENAALNEELKRLAREAVAAAAVSTIAAPAGFDAIDAALAGRSGSSDGANSNSDHPESSAMAALHQRVVKLKEALQATIIREAQARRECARLREILAAVKRKLAERVAANASSVSVRTPLPQPSFVSPVTKLVSDALQSIDGSADDYSESIDTSAHDVTETGRFEGELYTELQRHLEASDMVASGQLAAAANGDREQEQGERTRSASASRAVTETPLTARKRPAHQPSSSEGDGTVVSPGNRGPNMSPHPPQAMLQQAPFVPAGSAARPRKPKPSPLSLDSPPRTAAPSSQAGLTQRTAVKQSARKQPQLPVPELSQLQLLSHTLQHRKHSLTNVLDVGSPPAPPPLEFTTSATDIGNPQASPARSPQKSAAARLLSPARAGGTRPGSNTRASVHPISAAFLKTAASVPNVGVGLSGLGSASSATQRQDRVKALKEAVSRFEAPGKR